MISKTEFADLLKTLVSVIETGDTDQIMDSLKEVQEHYNSALDVTSREETDWKQKFEDMKNKYIERFFSGAEEAIEEQKEDISKDITDKTDITIDELFEKRESDYRERN